MHRFAPVLTSFVGRAGAVAEVAGLLERHRLVTVTGPGGSGKTRLAGEVAGRVADRFADGVWLAELAAVRDPAQVPAVVGASLGVREQPGEPTAEAVARALAGQQLLLVLDNCEHVVGAAAGLCAGVLSAADDVRVLATSREPLRVAGEARYRLAPGRQRSLAATVAWSYELLDDHERRVFRAISVFPGPFTLEAAEAVAVAGAGPAVLHLVDCSLLGPPRADPDGRFRYVMLETLRGYGARRLAEAGEQEQAEAELAGYQPGQGARAHR